MIRKTSLSICTALTFLAAAGAFVSASAEDMRSRKAQVPEISSDDAAKALTTIMPGPAITAPNVMLAPKAGMKPLSAEDLIKGLAAVKRGADGKETVIEVPARLQQMLKAKRAMAPSKAAKGKFTQVKNTKVYPYSAIGLLSNGCTGTTVMNNYVLTAAYCVYDREKKQFYKDLTYTPALSGNDAPVGTVKATNTWVAKSFIDSGDLNFAYALIELDKKIGDDTGWLGFGPLPGSDKVKALQFTGYPLAGVKQQTMWETICPIDGADENALFYKCPGKSDQIFNTFGAAMYIAPKNEGDGAQLIGIQNGAQDEKRNSFWAQNISEAHTQAILAWANGGQVEEPPVDGGDEEDTGDETDVSTNDTPECTCDQGGGDGGTDTTDKTGGDEEEDTGGGDIAEKPKSN